MQHLYGTKTTKRDPWLHSRIRRIVFMAVLALLTFSTGFGLAQNSADGAIHGQVVDNS